MSWLAPLFSGGVLLAPGLLKFTLVNPSGKPHEHALADPLRFRLKWFFASLLVVIVLLAFASWPAHSQGILVPRGAVWKYFDQGIDLGTAWRGTGFGDGSWASGPARLGFGGDGEVTMVSYGPDPNNKYVTTYFRKSFYVTNAAALTTLTLNLLRDDGAVVYLNGVEVRRDNMPAGTITYTNYASSVVGERMNRPISRQAWLAARWSMAPTSSPSKFTRPTLAAATSPSTSNCGAPTFRQS